MIIEVNGKKTIHGYTYFLFNLSLQDHGLKGNRFFVLLEVIDVFLRLTDIFFLVNCERIFFPFVINFSLGILRYVM